MNFSLYACQLLLRFSKKYLWDINAQPNLFPKSFFNSWTNPPFDFSLDLYVFNKAKKQKLNIIRLLFYLKIVFLFF